MNSHTIIGIDLAKTVFQVGIMKNGKLMSNKQVKRSQLHVFAANQPPSIIAMGHATPLTTRRVNSNITAIASNSFQHNT